MLPISITIYQKTPKHVNFMFVFCRNSSTLHQTWSDLVLCAVWTHSKNLKNAVFIIFDNSDLFWLRNRKFHHSTICQSGEISFQRCKPFSQNTLILTFFTSLRGSPISGRILMLKYMFECCYFLSFHTKSQLNLSFWVRYS